MKQTHKTLKSLKYNSFHAIQTKHVFLQVKSLQEP